MFHHELHSCFPPSDHLLLTGNVWHHPGWEPAGGRLWASRRIPWGLLESNPYFDGYAPESPAGTQPGPHYPHPIPHHHLWSAGKHPRNPYDDEVKPPWSQQEVKCFCVSCFLKTEYVISYDGETIHNLCHLIDVKCDNVGTISAYHYLCHWQLLTYLKSVTLNERKEAKASHFKWPFYKVKPYDSSNSEASVTMQKFGKGTYWYYHSWFFCKHENTMSLRAQWQGKTALTLEQIPAVEGSSLSKEVNWKGLHFIWCSGLTIMTLSPLTVVLPFVHVISRAKECDRATTQETILPLMKGATWWRQTKITTMSGRIRDATACLLAHSIAESSRTPTRTTRTLIRMHTSHIATAVHRAATAMTPGTDSELTSITTRG